jgi:hypothetical protein
MTGIFERFGESCDAASYVTIARDADRWLEEHRSESIGTADERDLQAYLFTRGSVEERNAALVAVMFFLTWAEGRGLVERNAAEGLELLG